MGTHRGRRVIGIVAAACVWLAGLTGPAAAAARSMATASGWTITDVVRVGQLGFTYIGSNPIAGPEGEVGVVGTRNGRTGNYRVKDGVVTELAVAGTVLPNGWGTVTRPGDVLFLSNGDVIFEAEATGGSLQSDFNYAFRWSNGTITLAAPFQETDPLNFDQAFDHHLWHRTSDDRWLTTLQYFNPSGPSGGLVYDFTRMFGLTNGSVYSTPFQATASLNGCVQTEVHGAAANARNLLVYHETVTDPSGNGEGCNDSSYTTAWSLKLAGANTGLLASGSFARQEGKGCTGSQLHTNSSRLFVNDRNQVAVLRAVYGVECQVTSLQLVVFDDGGGETILADTSGPLSTISPMDMDEDGFVLYTAELDNSQGTWVMVGSDLGSEVVLASGDPLFGSTVVGFINAGRWAPIDVPERAFAFYYTLADGSAGIGLASKRTPRWSNPNGGSWGTGANWSTGSVPGADATVRFGPDATYAVDLGTQQADTVLVEQGDVTFRSGSLTITGTNASMLDVSGLLTSPAKLTISGAGTQVTATVMVGFNGAGELTIDDAVVWKNTNPPNTSAPYIGYGGPSTVTVRNGGFWVWDELELGMNHPALLRVEDGGWVGMAGRRAVIGGSSLGFPLQNATAQLAVDGAQGVATTFGPLLEDMVIGEGLIGEVNVTNGGLVAAVTTTIGTRDHGAATDGFLTVDGVNTRDPSEFVSQGVEDEGGLFASTAAGTDSFIQVSGGGAMTLTRLSLAQAAGSRAYMAVDGTAGGQSGGRRSTVVASDSYTTTTEGGECVVGHGGRGTLQVTNGSLLRCRRLAVGYLSGSRGVLEVDGFLGDYAEIAVADPDGDEVFGPALGYGAICVGSAPLCDPSIGAPRNNVQGDMLVGADGYVTARVVVVGAGGRLLGNGIVSTDDGVLVANGGRVAPGVIQLTNPRGMRTTTETLGTLTIEGGLTVSESGVISLSVLGPTASQQDLLVVSGTLDMRGQVALIFGNGYAPKAGETLELMRAMTMTSASPTVTISGLADGFAYEIDGVGDALTLTALNDGVPETTGGGEAGSRVFVPLVRR